MIPLSSIATIDDLIVNLLRLGYKKQYQEYKEGSSQEFFEENYKNVFKILKVPERNVVRVFINHKNKPEDPELTFGDVALGCEVVGQYYPYIKQWVIGESFVGSQKKISWEDAEFIDLTNIDGYLDKAAKSIFDAPKCLFDEDEEDVIF